MKKLYRKGTVHPSPPIISDQLSFLPATIFTLTLALSPEDREVLAYLISRSSNNFSANPRRNTAKSAAPKGVVGGDHPPLFHCSCFRCYMSYWGRWDSSPNHQLIHEIIDAYEDWLAQNTKGGKNGNGRKEKRNKRGSNNKSGELKRSEFANSAHDVLDESESVGESSNSGGGGGGGGGGEDGEGGDGDGDEEKGSVRRFVSFIGERIWGAWGQ